MPSLPGGASACRLAGHEPGPGLRLRGERPRRRRRARRRPPRRACAKRAGTRRPRFCPRSPTVLREAGVERRALSLIAVTIGPGSFTGVRVGLAAARGLAVALGVPLAGIATTSACWRRPSRATGSRVAAIDSHLGDWFCAIGGDGHGTRRAGAVRRDGARARRASGRQAVPRHRLGAQTLVPQLVAAGIDAVAQEALPDPVIIARLAAEQGSKPGAGATGPTACRARSICAASTSRCPMARGGRSIE